MSVVRHPPGLGRKQGWGLWADTCPCPSQPMPMNFGWVWVRYLSSWVGIGGHGCDITVHGWVCVGIVAILLFMDGHGWA